MMMREEGRWEGTHIHGRVLLTLAMTRTRSNFHAWNHMWFCFLLIFFFSFVSNARAQMHAWDASKSQAQWKPPFTLVFFLLLLLRTLLAMSDVDACMNGKQIMGRRAR